MANYRDAFQEKKKEEKKPSYMEPDARIMS